MSAKEALQYAEQVADVLGDQWDHTPGCQMWAACPLCHLLASVRALAEAEDAEPTEAEVEAAAAVFHAEGWTCEGHEPLGLDECEQCGPATRRAARAALRAAKESRR